MTLAAASPTKVPAFWATEIRLAEATTRIKKLAQQNEFSYDAVYDIMNEEKKSELDTVTIKNETLRKYFPRNYTPRQMESIIIKLLDQWQLKKQQAKQKKQEEAR